MEYWVGLRNEINWESETNIRRCLCLHKIDLDITWAIMYKSPRHLHSHLNDYPRKDNHQGLLALLHFFMWCILSKPSNGLMETTWLELSIHSAPEWCQPDNWKRLEMLIWKWGNISSPNLSDIWILIFTRDPIKQDEGQISKEDFITELCTKITDLAKVYCMPFFLTIKL